DVGAELAQQIVPQTLHLSLPNVGEDVIQVEVVALDQFRSVAPIELFQSFDLGPECALVDVVMAEQGALHVSRDQGLVEVPDHRDHVLGEELLVHGGLMRLSGSAESSTLSCYGSPMFDLYQSVRTVEVDGVEIAYTDHGP